MTYHVTVDGAEWPESRTPDPGAAVERAAYLMGEFPTADVAVIEDDPRDGPAVFWANDPVR